MIVGILQARVTSSRLPGKVLLPIRHETAVVLAARRAANLGMRVIVATSDSSADDLLAAILTERGVPVVRGPLDDVLKRFVIATEAMPEDAIVVRLTADNLFPDGAFVGELAEELQRSGRAYVGTSSPLDGLPYGLSAEAFTVALLRQADREAVSAFDREHVTSWMRRQLPGRVFRPKALREDLSHLRCTMDCVEDYETLAKVFSSVGDPVKASWIELCQALEHGQPVPRIVKRPCGGRRMGELVLGTAQLGLPSYGRTNLIGRPEPGVAIQLIRRAVRQGVDWVDTARAYDRAERIAGDALKPFGGRVEVITKLSPLSDLAPHADAQLVNAAVDASVFRSCRELGMRFLPVLLLHRWAHRSSHRGAVWRRLLELRQEGVIAKLGASVSSPEEAKAALNDGLIGHLQIPFNVLDYRWQEAGIDALAVQRSDVVIHARSLFLQGILAAEPGAWPRIAGVRPADFVDRLEALAGALGRRTRIELCLAFARAQSWIHGLVIGVESQAQFDELLELWQRPPLDANEQEQVRRAFPAVPEELLNPALWSPK